MALPTHLPRFAFALQLGRSSALSACVCLAIACNNGGSGPAMGQAQDALSPNGSASNTNGTQPAAGDPNAGTNAVAATPNSTAPASKPIAWPNLNFVNNPGGNDNKAIALSFDDGPDGVGSPEGAVGRSNTSYMLDQLDALKLKATFFLCGNMWTDTLNDASAIADVKRIVAAGHAIGSHTYKHLTWDNNITAAQLQDAIALNDKVYQDPKIFGPNFAFTLWRAPYGQPFQDGSVYPPEPSAVAAVINKVAPYSPPNAVHVGWGIDSKDWMCAQNPATATDQNCVLKNVETFLNAGASGVILMHSVYKLSADTLPKIVQSILNHNYRIVQVEDFIKAKYGASSAAISAANKASTFDAPALSAAALAATQASKWYLQTNEN